MPFDLSVELIPFISNRKTIQNLQTNNYIYIYIIWETVYSCLYLTVLRAHDHFHIINIDLSVKIRGRSCEFFACLTDLTACLSCQGGPSDDCMLTAISLTAIVWYALFLILTILEPYQLFWNPFPTFIFLINLRLTTVPVFSSAPKPNWMFCTFLSLFPRMTNKSFMTVLPRSDKLFPFLLGYT